MATDTSRIAELRRRVQRDPASIAFAPLAEELRRAGQYFESVQTCLAGLEHHPGFLSARVTLGRALAALEQYREARTEFEAVLRVAPDNLVASRCLAELPPRPGETVVPPRVDPQLAALEAWLTGIEADRAARQAGRATIESRSRHVASKPASA